ncbi:Dolichol phosphate-mannose biosynthesis regulatory protein [Rhodotorula toruloides]
MSFFLYYTLWTLLSPFLPPSSPLLILFPLSREWAIRLPALVLLFGLCFVGMVTGFVLIETAKKKERGKLARSGAGRRKAGRARAKGD